MQQLAQLWVFGDQLGHGAGQLVGEAGDDGPGLQAIPPEQGALWAQGVQEVDSLGWRS